MLKQTTRVIVSAMLGGRYVYVKTYDFTNMLGFSSLALATRFKRNVERKGVRHKVYGNIPGISVRTQLVRL